MKKYFTPEIILAFSLGFVCLWFGLDEIFVPKNWVGFAPEFLGTGALVNALVLAHGVVLTVCGVLLVVNRWRRYAAMVVALVMAEIIVDLLIQQIAMDIIVRDVGILGMALALTPPCTKKTA